MIKFAKLLRHEFATSFAGLMRIPGFSITVIVTMAVTLASLAVVLNINYLVLAKPLPYPDAEHMMVTSQSETINGETQYGFQLLPTQLLIYNNESYIDTMAIMSLQGDRLRELPGAPYLDGKRVTPEYFDLLNIPMLHGRAFNQDEGVTDQQTVMVLSYAAWQKHFSGDENIVGQTVQVGQWRYKVIGIADKDFVAPEIFGSFPIEAWFSFPEALSYTANWDMITSSLTGIAKLKAGVSVDQVNQALGQQINELYQSRENVAPNTSIGLKMVSLKDSIIGDGRTRALLLLVGVVTLLFIAVSNITNLFLSRAAQKQRVIAIQAAIGAKSKHLLLSLFTEAFVLLMIACFVGLIIAAWVLIFLQNDLQYMFTRLQNISLNSITIGASVFASVLIAVIVAVVTLRQVNYQSLTDVLHASGKGTSGQISKLTRDTLVALQVTFATMLLIGATAVLQPVVERLTQKTGFYSEQLHYLYVDRGNYQGDVFSLSQQIKQAISEESNIESISEIYITPLHMGWENYLYDKNNDLLGIVSTGNVGGGLFDVMQHPLIAGRTFSPYSSVEDVPSEIIISESLAKRVFKDSNPVGQVLQVTRNEPLTVVGVVSDIYVPDQGFDYAVERYYLPYRGGRVAFVMRGKSAISHQQIEQILSKIDPNLRISQLHQVDFLLSQRLRESKLIAWLTVSLLLLALSLAAAGIYGVLSYTVHMRRFELGIHLSLGAHTQTVIKMVVSQNLKPILIGLSLGIIGAGMVHLLLNQVWQYQLRADFVSFVLALPIMLLVALFACYWPVKQVVHADPIKALRNE